MKKILSIVLSVAMFATMSVTAFAAAEPYKLKINGTEYTVSSSFEDCITSSGVPTNTITSLEILSGKIVMQDWFYIMQQCGGGATPNMSQSLETVYIGNDVVLESMQGGTGNELGMGAFQHDKKLKTAYVGSAQEIAGFAFLGCESLIEVTAPNVEKIASDVFEDCTALVKLNLPATPPTASNFANTPADKSLGFVSADGTDLTGTALTEAISAYKAVDDGDINDNYWYGFKISDRNSIAPSDDLGNGTGDSNITMNGSTIPAPTYTVTIPEKIVFDKVSKKLNSASQSDAIAKTGEQTVTILHSNLFDNQKNVTVTVSTDNKIKNGSNEIAFDLFEKSITDTKITSGTNLFSVNPATSLVNETETKMIYATLDQRLIKASGIYTGTVTFTVALADNK